MNNLSDSLKNGHKRILITGANGFIGKNLCVRLGELNGIKINTFLRGDDKNILPKLISESDFVVHLAGENRPINSTDFEEVNIGLTSSICEALVQEKNLTGRKLPLIFTSSIQAQSNSPYGLSKASAEKIVEDLANKHQYPVILYRLPNVFGKWSKPNYNSVVATFCNNIARGLPVEIHDPNRVLDLVYIDDVISSIINQICYPSVQGFAFLHVSPEYQVKLGLLAIQIQKFEECRNNLIIERTGTGFIRALYSTYLSYLPPDRFAYPVPIYKDERGVFVEMLKTPDCGQFSFFTVEQGVTRGSHYHHTKSEKFMVLKGEVKMRFLHLITGEVYSIVSSSEKPEVIDSIPGWAHDITNIGKTDAVVMLWANEIFDRNNPDCISYILK